MNHYEANWDKYKKSPYTPQPWGKEPDHFYKEVKKVAKPLTIEDLFPKLDRWAIGYNTTLDALQQLSKVAKTQSYPPYNIIKFGDGKFQVRIAVAGFRREEIKVSVEERTLTVESDTEFKLGDTHEVQVGELLHQGIAERDFKQTFALAEYVEVEDAKLEDGILTINLVTNIPEEKKPKVIDIK
jgi:molecular chaperone IbpA